MKENSIFIFQQSGGTKRISSWGQKRLKLDNSVKLFTLQKDCVILLLSFSHKAYIIYPKAVLPGKRNVSSSPLTEVYCHS